MSQQLPLYSVARDKAIRALLIRAADRARDLSDADVALLIERLREVHARRWELGRAELRGELESAERDAAGLVGDAA